MISGALHILILAMLPPLLPGVINKVKALFAGRVGPPLLQPYYDILKLLQKRSVTSRTTTLVFIAGPAVGTATVLVAGLLLPVHQGGAPIAFTGDVILFAYLLGLGRFFTAAAALDTGSPFEGMGAAREVSFASFAEPALFAVFLVLARLSGSLSLSVMLDGSLAGAWTSAGPALALTLAALFIILLAENCRIPFDDPNTHLELTMIHEVMVLDHSGPAFGAILYAAAVKLFLLSALIARVLMPTRAGSALTDLVAFVGLVIVVAIVVGVVESVMARLRLVHVPGLLISAGLLAGVAFLLVGQLA